MTSRAVARAARTVVTVEAFNSRDAQGKPTYAQGTDVLGRHVREDQVVSRGDGAEVMTQHTLWFEADVDPLPRENDRLAFETLGELRTVIVVDRYEGKSLRGAPRFVRARCREE